MSLIKNEYTLIVDLKKPTTNIRPRFIQYDTAILYFKVYDNGKDFNFSEQTEIQVAHRKKSGKTEVGRATVVTGNDGKPLIKYEYMGSEMNEVGNVTTSVSILSGTKKVTIQPFIVEMIKDIHSGIVDNVNKEYSLLQQLITTVESAVQSALDSAKLVKDAVDNANSAVNEIDTKLPLLDAVISQEETRKTNEAKRIADENTRISNESTRVSAENERISDETVRKNSEASRATSETQRVTNETNRVNAENTRVTNEDVRKTNELVRVSEETIRVNNESSRISNENTRNTAESNRVSKESSRVTAENKRVTDENTRQVNESNRISAETTRATNETNRQSTFNGKITEVNSLISNTQTIINNAETVINDTVSAGNFILGQYYKKNNLVLHNGSTFIALTDTQNNPLPTLPVVENNWWRLVAQRGTDGTGSVSKVNNIAPDVNGNVTLDLGDSITMVDGFSPNELGNVTTHTNKAVLDKLSEKSGELTYNGKSIGKVSTVNSILPDSNGDIAIPSIHKGNTPPTKTINLWIDTN